LGVILVASGLCLVSGAILTEVIKNGVSRPRPAAYFTAAEPAASNGDAARSFDVHIVGRRLAGNSSFPSGHSWASFAVATLMTLFFGRKYAWAYLAAAAIAYSRIYSGVHFPLDVLGGAAGGTLMAFLTWQVMAWVAPDRALPAASTGNTS
jgi:undecaprenyl-diphosphatase